MTLFRSLILCCFMVWLPTFVWAQPGNDNCASATDINIGSAGFALGSFPSTQVNISTATLQAGETFAPGILTAGLSKKSIWFKFSLPTTRSVEVFLKQPAVAIADGDVGFAVYATSTCLPGDAQISTKLTPIAKFASSKHPCLDAGDYYIQVSANNNANGLVFISLDIAEPSPAPYDKPATASKFGKLGTYKTTGIDFDVSCQSIDDANEVCLAGTAFKDYTKSTWHTFTTPDYFDWLAVLISSYQSVGNNFNFKIGYRLFEGDITNTPLASLTQIGNCDSLFWKGDISDFKGYKCGQLKPNTTYTVQLLYHKDFVRPLRFAVGWDGKAPTRAPQPVSGIPAANKIGVLPGSFTMTRINVTPDNFACNARHNLYNCPKTLPPAGLATKPSGYNVTQNMSTFYSFTLANTADLSFYAYSVCGAATHVRLYKQSLTSSCGDLDTLNMIADFDVGSSISCLPPGDYVVQLMGSDAPYLFGLPYYNELATNYNGNSGLCIYSNLGKEITLRIDVTKQQEINGFSLNKPGAFDKINADVAGVLQPVPFYTTITTKPDTLGCENTVVPKDICGYEKASFREFLVADSGAFRVESGVYGYLHLYKGDVNALAVGQNAFTWPKNITGLETMRKCMWNTNPQNTSTCITPGTFSLVTMGPQIDARYNTSNIHQPSISFIAPRTKFNSPQNTEDMGDLWARLGPGGGLLTSSVDTFSCYDNAAVIDGFNGSTCWGPFPSTKLIYRQFYLNQTSAIQISTGLYGYPGYNGYLTLYSGKVSDGTTGLKIVGNWKCFYDKSNGGSCSDLLPAGWYTVIAYGYGGSYQNPLQTTDAQGNHYTMIGLANAFYVKLIPNSCASPRFNRPHKASIDTLTGQPYKIEWAPQTGHTAAYPRLGKTYTLNKENFDCTQDTAFIRQQMNGCSSANAKVAFYVFTTTQEAYIRIDVPANYWSKLYAFDVRTKDSLRLKNGVDTALHPCTDKSNTLEFCRLQPGTYTLVIFASEIYTCNSITPTIYIDAVGFSRFDHAAKAYDFGDIKPDNTWYKGKIGDVNPLNPGRAPSNDFFYCTTGAQVNDPDNGKGCYTVYNPYTYPSRPNQVMHPVYSQPTYYQDRRTLWHTFTISKPGNIGVRVNGIKGNQNVTQNFAIYRSDEDGSLPFSTLQANGNVDSTVVQGLTLIGISNSSCSYRGVNSGSFFVEPCNFKPTRYYIVTDNFYQDDVNFQVEVEVLLDSVAAKPPKFDHFSQANDLGLVNSGKKKGAVDNFTCATRDLPDPLYYYNNCQKTLWYKFTTTVTGTIRYTAFFKNTNNYYYDHIQLFRQIKPGDSSSNGLLHLNHTSSYSDNGNWAVQCINPGTYYILLPGCNALNEDVYPEIEIIPQAGDFCSNPMVASLNGVGNTVVPVKVDCHTIGTDYGEFNQTLTCPAGAATNLYKTSWYRLDVTGTDTLDITVFINEKTNAGSTDIKYRMMTGSCGAMQEQSCVQDALTRNTYECMIPGKSYYIQVFTPVMIGGYPVTGDIDLNISSVKHITTCAPANNCIAVAEFFPKFDCTKDRNISITNLSTFGSDIKYDWDFGYNNQKSTAVAPEFFYPALTTNKTYTITLTVTNTVCNKKDVISKTIDIPARPAVNLGNDTVICAGPASVALDATSHAGTTYQWYQWLGYWNPFNTNAKINVTTLSGLIVDLTYNGCKARDTINVWINPIAKRALQTKALCNTADVTLDANRGYGETFQWNTGAVTSNIKVVQPGTYWCNVYLNGCIVRDSFLVISPAVGNNAVRKVNVCQKDMPYAADATISGASSYAWSDNNSNAKRNLSAPGIWWVDVSVSGCTIRDSISLAVDSFKTVTTAARICSGQNYQLPSGKVVSITGTYKDSLKNVRGCDSIVTTLNLKVDSLVRKTITTSVCAGQSYLLPSGRRINTTGNYTDTVRFVSGCDSIISNVSLQVANPIQKAVKDTICFGKTYTLPAGKIVTTTGVYVDTIKAKAGCDSLITSTTLTVLQPIVYTGNASVCFGKTFTLPSGKIVSTTGLYKDTVRYTNGCDSLISNITLAIGSAIKDNKTIPVCAGQTYTLPSGVVVNTAGIYNDTVRSVAGCDSLISVINLVVQSATSKTISDFICGGKNYTLPSGKIVNTSGQWLDTLRYPTGCDSIRYSIQLTVFNTITQTANASICFGTTYTLPSGKIVNANGLYRDTIRYANGCDSLISNITLSVGNAIKENKSIVICAGQTYTLPSGIVKNTTGVYNDTVRSVAGCDSLISVIDLVVQSATSKIFSDIICSGKDYTLPSGKIVNTSGQWLDTLRYRTGCDSIRYSIQLTVFNTMTQTANVSICFGTTYTLPSGKIVNANGLYRDTIRYANGCDSLISNITLSVGNAIKENKSIVICAGQTYTLPSGIVKNTTGVYNDTVRSVAGCDSLISVIDLVVQSATSKSISDFICSGKNYTLPSGKTVNSSGLYDDTIRYSSGCDSIRYSIQLTVFNTITKSSNASICFGTSYTLPSGRMVSTSGLYHDTIRFVNGCDSLISQINLSVGSPIRENKNISICLGQSYTLPSGIRVNTPNTYIDTVSNQAGCDSLITTTTLNVDIPQTRIINRSICNNSSYLSPSGKQWSMPGSYKDTLQNTRGCDSLHLTINLTVENVARITVDTSICAGQSVVLPGGKKVSNAGVYYDTLQTNIGCDSIITTRLTVRSALQVVLSAPASICAGETINITGNATGGTGGPYTYQWTGMNATTNSITVSPVITTTYKLTVNDGCTVAAATDSIVVQVTAIPNSNFTLSATSGCQPLQVTFNSATANANHRWQFGTGIVGDTSITQNTSFRFVVPGTYQINHIATTASGCTSTSTQSVTVYAKPTTTITAAASVCVGGSVSFTSNANMPANSYSWSFANGQTSALAIPTPVNFNTAGTYTIQLITSTANNCRDTAIHTLKVNPLPNIGLNGKSITICRGSNIMLNAKDGVTYQWSPTAGLNNNSIANPIASPTSNITYHVTASNSFNCQATDSIKLLVTQPFTMVTTADTIVCIGNTVTLKASGAQRYEWTGAGSNNTANNITVKPNSTTSYTVTGRGIDSCFTQTKTIRVTVIPLPTVNAGNDTTIMVGNAVPLSPVYSNDVVKYTWSPADQLNCINCPNPIATPLKEITYKVVVENQYQCKAEDSRKISLVCNTNSVFVPNTFTPNGDGMNDVWYPRGNGIQNIRYLRVFNRWGQMIFERTNFNSDDRSAGWDGNFKGQPVPPEVYVYSLGMICSNGQVVDSKGNVMVVR